jgi:peptide subunit release factor 1 (eRF1)
LRVQHVDDAIALTRMPLRAGDGVTPRRGIVRVSGEEVSDTRVVEDVIGRESPDPGKSTDIDGEPGAARDVLWCCF